METSLPTFRLGNVSPTGGINDIQPYEFYRIAPPSVIQVSVGLGLQEYTRANTEEALQRWWACLDRLMARRAAMRSPAGGWKSTRLRAKRELRPLQRCPCSSCQVLKCA